MSIDDYRPQFMVEAVYDLKPDQLREHGIRTVLVDLDNTLIAGTTLMGLLSYELG